MNKKEIASKLNYIATLLELNHENSFKVRAFSSASRILQTSELETDELIEQVRAKKIKGIGPQLSECILSFYDSGYSPTLADLKKRFSPDFLELLELPKLGVKKLKMLRNTLGIESIQQLEEACRSSALSEIKGFGVKTEEHLLTAITRHKEYKALRRLDEAESIARECGELLSSLPEVKEIRATGELLRRCEIVTKIELCVASEKELKDSISQLEQIKDCEELDSKTLEVSFEDKASKTSKIALRICEPKTIAEVQHAYSGSRAYTKKIKTLVSDLTFTEPEQEHYKKMGLAFIPPELRENASIVEKASALFADGHKEFDLVQHADIQGVIHAHSSYSDGADSIESMARAAIEKGYSYLALTDHSQTASYAGGLVEDDIKRQHEEIDELNEKLAPFVVFKGIESDILSDGSLDYREKVLESFDFVIASVHSGFSKDIKKMTSRIVTALQNPHCTILGHLSGRLLLMREGYGLDIDEVLEVAAQENVAVELNCNPKRLELDWRFHQKARSLGIKVPLAPDAHSTSQIDYIRYGVEIARKGELRSSDVLNTLSAEQFRDYIGSKNG